MAASASLDEVEEIYRNRGADFLRLAVARLGNHDVARDAVQEGFAQAIRRRKSFRREGPLEAWIARCVINAARDLERRSRRFGHSSVDYSDPSTTAASESHEWMVRAAVARLPQRQRDALFLRYYLDFDYGTIAKTLGIEVGTVSAMLHTARASLAGTLQEVTQ